MTTNTIAAAAHMSIIHGWLMEICSDSIVLGLPETDYRLRLAVDPQILPKLPSIGASLSGVIHAQTGDVEVLRTGGRYIEPLYGRPRHLQGNVVGVDSPANALLIECGCVFVCFLTCQHAVDFVPNQLVGCEIELMARFTPLPVGHLDSAQPAQVVLTSHENPMPADHSPAKNFQDPDQNAPTKPGDAGALGTSREITGMEPSTGDFPIDGE